MTGMLHCGTLLVLLGRIGAASAAAALPPYPAVRFTSWKDLPAALRDRARAAGYHGKSWNNGASDAEDLDYESLLSEMVAFLESIPMSAEAWDCYVNHYRNYEWDELAKTARISYAALGWTDDMWDSDDEPKEEGKYWEDLTEAQRQAAAGFCYTREIWDEVPIPLWGEDDGAGGVAGEKDAADLYSTQETQVAAEKAIIYEQMYGNDDQSMVFNGPASAHNDRGIEVPLFRYDPWDWLHPDMLATAERADYDEKSWNAIRTNRLEKMDWETIGEDHPVIRRALHSLGFSEMQWDCYVTHYRTYSWGELKEAGVQKHYKTMGYNHNTWEQDLSPEVDGMYWPTMTQAQQDAAYQVGYFRETWDEVSLQFWPRTTSNTASLKAYVQQHKAAAAALVGWTTALVIGLIVAWGYFCRIATATKKNNTAGGEYEMKSGSRFADYSDVAPGAGFDKVAYDEDPQPAEAHPPDNSPLGPDERELAMAMAMSSLSSQPCITNTTVY